MSNSATDPTNTSTTMSVDSTNASPAGKGKGKATEDVSMEDEEEEEEDEDEEGDEEEEEDEEDSFEEIDPSAILPTGRRTRGVKVDYTSKEALAKAGLDANAADEDDDDDVDMKAIERWERVDAGACTTSLGMMCGYGQDGKTRYEPSPEIRLY
ncbi:hypothetical protein BDQ12DRAFT_708178 [Crucibulum laeve]|uniref:Histone chaperone domain-containing protein n=1 Tax=Crucibulum laeve TaxID=68775 RepID=A0A5C3MG02_9AGAR|nr:hypothetical protein BDQ12DRAFT_708178 [Crucibulum laeve]